MFWSANPNMRGRWFYTINKQSSLQFNSILKWSTQRQQHIPQVKGLVPQDCPLLWTLIVSLGCYLCFRPHRYIGPEQSSSVLLEFEAGTVACEKVLGALWTLSSLGFHKGFLTQKWLSHWQSIQLSAPSLYQPWWDWKLQPSNYMVGFLGNQPHP